MNILHLDSSPLGSQSVSRELSADIVEALHRSFPSSTRVYRDLVSMPLPHWSPAEAGGPDSQAVLAEFLAADTVVIGAPMYNFGLPSQLKAWLDRVLVAGQTFRYGPSGPEPLTQGKRAFVVSTRGDVYTSGSAGERMDFQERHLLAALDFVGVRDVHIIRAEGLALGETARAQALTHARAVLAERMPGLPLAA